MVTTATLDENEQALCEYHAWEAAQPPVTPEQQEEARRTLQARLRKSRAEALDTAARYEERLRRIAAPGDPEYVDPSQSWVVEAFGFESAKQPVQWLEFPDRERAETYARSIAEYGCRTDEQTIYLPAKNFASLRVRPKESA